MAIKPILFSTPMVQAILENRKKQSRRKCAHQYWQHSELVDFNDNGCHIKVDKNVTSKYQVGDILWVRETWRQGKIVRFDYKADYPESINWVIKRFWKPSIHMPKAAARIFLEVTNVRVERLFDISEKDAIAEGIIVIEPEEAYISYDKGVGSYATARGSFFSLWSSINGQASTDANPWVFVYEFKRIDKPTNWPH